MQDPDTIQLITWLLTNEINNLTHNLTTIYWFKIDFIASAKKIGS